MQVLVMLFGKKPLFCITTTVISRKKLLLDIWPPDNADALKAACVFLQPQFVSCALIHFILAYSALSNPACLVVLL